MLCRWPGGAGDLSSSYQTSAAGGNSQCGKWCLTLPMEECQLPTAPLLQMNRKSVGASMDVCLAPSSTPEEIRGPEANGKAQLGLVGLSQLSKVYCQRGTASKPFLFYFHDSLLLLAASNFFQYHDSSLILRKIFEEK